MGIYVTTTSISLILPGFLKGNTTTSDTEGTNIFSEKVDDAESLVNAQITRLYDLPFTNSPPIVRTLVKKIACYFIFQDTGYRSKNENPYFKEYQTSLKLLDGISKGDITLSYTNGSLVPRRSGARFLSNTKNYTPIFGLDDATTWDRDSDEIEDQNNARS